jgi:hypothetical protein
VAGFCERGNKQFWLYKMRSVATDGRGLIPGSGGKCFFVKASNRTLGCTQSPHDW